MKKILTILLTLPLVVLFLCSCSSDDSDPISSSITGEWETSTLTIYSSTYNETADPYVKKAFNDVLTENKIKRIFKEEGKTVETSYTNSDGTEIIYANEAYEIKKDSLYLTHNGNTKSYRYTLSQNILTTEWDVNKTQLTTILSQMDKASVAIRLPDDYSGKITFVEKRKSSN